MHINLKMIRNWDLFVLSFGNFKNKLSYNLPWWATLYTYLWRKQKLPSLFSKNGFSSINLWKLFRFLPRIISFAFYFPVHKQTNNIKAIISIEKEKWNILKQENHTLYTVKNKLIYSFVLISNYIKNTCSNKK